jgi:hypothetical protein
MLSVTNMPIWLNDVMLKVIMLSVVAPGLGILVNILDFGENTVKRLRKT